MKKIFGRYMLFIWNGDNENGSPFECLESHSNDYQTVKNEYDHIVGEESDFVLIFDRVEGIINNSWENEADE